MIKIWRVENKQGEGCYWGKSTRIILNRHKNPRTHPTPAYDWGIRRPPKQNEICGFINKQQALKWFSQDELDLLLAFNFRLKEIEVTQITTIGQKQILAVR